MFDNVAVMIESNWFQKKYGTKIYTKRVVQYYLKGRIEMNCLLEPGM